MDWEPLVLTQLSAVAAMLALAGWVLYLNFESRTNRVLALVLVLRASVTLLNRLEGIDAARAPLWTALREYFVLGLLPAMAYFVVVLALPRRARLSRILSVAIVAGALAVEWAYLVDHCLARCPGPGGLTRLGPLALLTDGLPLGYALLGTTLAILAAREQGARAIALALAALAFLLQGALEGAIAVSVLARFGLAAPSTDFEPSVWASVLFPLRVLALVPVGLGVAAVLRVARHHGYAAAPLLAVVAFALGCGFAIGFSPAEGPIHSLAIGLVGLWLLVLPTFLAYAVLKYRLLGLDRRVRTGLRGVVVGGAFIATFFIATELAQGWLSERYGLTVGVITSGLLVFALAPLQHLGERVARVALPGEPSATDLSPHARAALYRDQAALAWGDGTLSRKERLLLNNLREQLGLSHEEAARIEGDITAHASEA